VFKVSKLQQYPEKYRRIIFFLLIALLCVSLGRAYQCLFWDIPIRSLLWNEKLLAPMISLFFGMSWSEYLLHPSANLVIQSLVTSIGIGLIVCCITFLLTTSKRLNFISLHLIFGLLIFIALLYHLEKFRTAGQFLEYTLQFMTPLILWQLLKYGITEAWIYLLKICIALTFVSHGLYALGFYPVPGNFVAMTIQILHCNDTFAIQFLMVVGILDLIFSLGLFLGGRVFKWSIIYCIAWGALTAFARIVANVEMDIFGSTMHQWAFETVYRIPHFTVPIVLYFAIKQQDRRAHE